MRRAYQRTKQFLKRYERFFVPGMLLGGLLIDFITFRFVQIETVFKLLGIHAGIAVSCITFIHLYDARWHFFERGIRRFLRLYAPLILQFNFGALLSAAFIFYWFSGSVLVSWPIILLIIALMASNDLFREYYLKPIVQLPVFFFAIFSVLSVVLPYLLKSIDPILFITSGIASITFFLFYLSFLTRISPVVRAQRNGILFIIMCIAGSMFALHAAKLIPPVPLSIREAGVFHGIERVNDTYVLTGEEYSLLDQLIPGSRIHIAEGQPVYVWSAIFAPEELATTVIHEWQYRENGEWVTKDEIPFSVVGGREDGFRGFSFKSSTEYGRWRVNVQTHRRQTLGQVYFQILPADNNIRLQIIQR